MNKKGFISTALIYTFFILFLILMVFLLNNYSSTRYTVDRYRYDIEEELFEQSNADINLYVFVWNNAEQEYKYVDNIPKGGFQEEISYCKNKSSIEFENGEISVVTSGKEFCYLYFEAAGNVTMPTISASDGKGSGTWHKGGLALNFSGSRVTDGVGGVEYYYSTDASNINTLGSTTGTLTTEGTYDYYVKACNTYNPDICSESAHYELKIDNNPPSCSISGNPTSWQNTNATLTQNGEDEGEGTIYYSWDNKNNYSTTKTTKTVTTNGTYTLYVKDGLGNETSCSESVTKIDKTQPSVSFGLSGQTATYSCSNGGSGSPLTGTTSGIQALSGTSNYTYSATCTDEAGNSKTDSHTYTYSSCVTGENTCQYGCSTPGHWVTDCGGGGWIADFTCTDSNHGGGDCKKHVNTGTYWSGWEFCSNCGGCNYVAASGCSYCYYGHNTCSGGFKF